MPPRSFRRAPIVTGLSLLVGWLGGAPLAGQPAVPPPAATELDRAFIGELRPIGFGAVRLEDEFWAPRIETVRRSTLPHCLEQCEQTGRLANFDRAAGRESGPHQGWFFNDSDVYKVLEGAANLLALRRDADLEQRVAALVERIAAAQQPDGYLNTYYTLHPNEQRWSDIGVKHELYCAGHLLEAGLALHAATGDERLLAVARRFVDHVRATFGPGGRADPPGHQEIELALLRLWRRTGDDELRARARFFVEQRGRAAGGRRLYGEYSQDHAPLAQQRAIVGHAVRALYFYSAATELLDETTRAEHWPALQTLWHDAVETKMYITGGIGNSSSNEGFTHSFDLPNDTAYAETCAAIALVFWAHRMNLQTADARYFDVAERALFNGVLSGISLDGRQFFYTNPLASRGQHRRQDWYACACCPTNLVRVLPTVGGYMYAVARDGTVFVNLYAAGSASFSIGASRQAGASSAASSPSVAVMMSDAAPMSDVARASTAHDRFEVRQRARYPWEGAVELEIVAAPSREFALALRIPGWCRGFQLTVNGVDERAAPFERGYVRLRRSWQTGDRIALTLDMPIERVEADPRVVVNRGRVALQRGPIVYCLEGVDQPVDPAGARASDSAVASAGSAASTTQNAASLDPGRISRVRHLALPRDTELRVEARPELLGGVSVIRGAALAPADTRDRRAARARDPDVADAVQAVADDAVAVPTDTGDAVPVHEIGADAWERPLYRAVAASHRVPFMAIPYYAWANRAPAEMIVWLPESLTVADAGPIAWLTPSASHCYGRDTLNALCDRVEPQNSHDASIPRFTWWPRRGSREWVQYDFRTPRTVAGVAVYWFDDTKQGGGCALPASRSVQVRVDGEWREVSLTAAGDVPRDAYDTLRFARARADAVRLDVQLQDGRSAGILEWRLMAE